VRIALKESVWGRAGDVLVVLCNPSMRIELHDPDGQVEMLLEVLAERPRTIAEVAAALAGRGIPASPADLAAAVDSLDGLKLLCREGDVTLGSADADERYFSNLAFFQLFSSLEQPAAEFQQRLGESHVVVLGAGGLGSNALQCLAGLGVGRLTLLDSDVVEARNYARQFVYTQRDIGQSKVHRAGEWLRRFDGTIEVRVVERRVTCPEDVADLLDRVGVVVSGIDRPDSVDDWVNAACVTAGVPWVRGGMWGGQLRYFSVAPGAGACLACRRVEQAAEPKSDVDAVADALLAQVSRVNRGIGPVAAMLGSLVAFEALRYLTGYEPPRAAAADVIIDLTDSWRQHRLAWRPNPDCALCRRARERLLAGQGAR
jgi:molybdopterin/thiamine biosynthesis adenylyltransferase